MKIESGAIPGFYIAWNPWFQVESPGRLHKVGHTGDLRRRLCDSAYVTCFPPDSFRYEATFETATKEDAYALEQAVLYYYRDARLSATSELVRGPTAVEMAERAAAIATALGLESLVRRELPVYERPPTEARATEAASAETPEPSQDWRRVVDEMRPPMLDDEFIKELVENFSPLAITKRPEDTDAAAIAKEAAEAAAAVALVGPEEDDVDDDLDDSSPFDVTAEKWEGLRDHQKEAVERCSVELEKEGRALLQMACRTGKTPVAFEIIRSRLERSAATNPAALMLVPGLPLLRQTAQKMAFYGFTGPMLLVGSDQMAIQLCDGRTLTMTTDPNQIQRFMVNEGPRLVICTYQSSPLLATDSFIITVFDEAHRVCGSRARGKFNHFVLAPRVGEHLFMTATPKKDAANDNTITMRDSEMFGGIAYRYHLRQGINSGYVNEFRLELVAVPTCEDGPSEVGSKQIMEAMGAVDKLLVFCRSIKAAVKLYRDTVEACGGEFECLVAHSRMRKGDSSKILRRFNEPEKRIVLFNCNLYREGVEVPMLGGVFFAAPRKSPQDIVQILCRALNKCPGKRQSVIFLPIQYDPALPADDPANLKRYQIISDFVEALSNEDPLFFDHLLNPRTTAYPIGVLGKELDDAAKLRLSRAVRHAARYAVGTTGKPIDKLLKPKNLPWNEAFAELKRTVTVCQRYPKGADVWVFGETRYEFHKFYKYVQEQYVAWQNREKTALEPYQIADLQSLPYWEKYGVNGPYIFEDALQILDDWLTEHNGEFPLVNVSNGGMITFDATRLERLSGVLTVCNQEDGRDHKSYKISATKRAIIERVANKWNLTWFRQRGEDGCVLDAKKRPKTFIEELQLIWQARPKDDPELLEHYPNYPTRHQRMETMFTIENNLAPPRKSSEKDTPGDDDQPKKKTRGRRPAKAK